MNAQSPLTQLANQLHQSSATPEDMAEFIRLVNGETELDVLKTLLPLNYNCAGVVLERISELVPDDPKALLSLALWKYSNGLDDQAQALLEKARALAPGDRDVLRANVWFSFSLGPKTVFNKARALLEAFPDDAWARDISRKILKDGKLIDLESPDWDNPWQIW